MEHAVSKSRSTFTAKFIDNEIEIICKNKDTLLQQINSLNTVLKKSLTLWKDFINAHGKAVVTLTQVDTKLTQLELLDTTDNIDDGNVREIGKDLGDLQVRIYNLNMYLKKNN